MDRQRDPPSGRPHRAHRLENYVSPRVLAAQGSVLTNKYAEVIPVNATGAAASTWTSPNASPLNASSSSLVPLYANVQPQPAWQANDGVYMALLNPGDTISGMSLAHGGHLTHGAEGEFLRQDLQRPCSTGLR